MTPTLTDTISAQSRDQRPNGKRRVIGERKVGAEHFNVPLLGGILWKRIEEEGKSGGFPSVESNDSLTGYCTLQAFIACVPPSPPMRLILVENGLELEL